MTNPTNIHNLSISLLADTNDAAAHPTSLSDNSEERELDVLAWVHHQQDPTVSQRSIASALGMSVGLTNAILKRLADKGLLMVKRINTHNVHYLVTPDGIDQITRRSYRYLRRTIGHVVRYKEILRDWCHQQKHQGTTEIHLLGESDLTFILEWCAHKESLTFRHTSGMPGTSSPSTSSPSSSIPTSPTTTVTVLSETVLTPTHPEDILLHGILFPELAGDDPGV